MRQETRERREEKGEERREKREERREKREERREKISKIGRGMMYSARTSLPLR